MILHESAHFLIRQLSRLPQPASPREQLEYLIFDEGLAHYAGFPPGRQRLLSATASMGSRRIRDGRRAGAPGRSASERD